jgi:hypothetical protein
VNLRSSPFLHWLRHTGVPLARPGVLLVTLTALLITTLGYLGFLSTDDGLLKHLPDLTAEGRAMVRQGGIQHGIFITCLLLAGLFCLARGMRFSRRLWLLLLIIVALADLWRIMLPAVSLIVSLLLGKPLSEIPAQEWTPLLPYLLIAGSFFILSLLLFLPPVNRWRKAMRELATTST